MKSIKFGLIMLTGIIFGCSTSAGFKIPPGTEMVINGERSAFKKEVDDNGYPVIEKKPFFWSSVAGIEYSLVQGDKIIKEGKLQAEFRVVSIFWPPYAFIYWPVGFKLSCYDLTKDFIEECLPVKSDNKAAQ